MIRKKNTAGFSMMEILVVISIIAILSALFISQTTGIAQKKARDSKRRADLETIRAALEIYRNDCGSYPSNLTSPLVGVGSSCSGNTYMNTVPVDPGKNAYLYSPSGSGYAICARLEAGTTSLCSISCTGNCGSSACTYSLCNP